MPGLYEIIVAGIMPPFAMDIISYFSKWLPIFDLVFWQIASTTGLSILPQLNRISLSGHFRILLNGVSI